LPAELRGRVDLVVSNPPYVAEDEVLPDSVVRWEPAGALVSGPSGLEAYEAIFAEADGWLAPDGAVVLEIGSTQGGAVTSLAIDAGFTHADVLTDHAGLDRCVVVRRSISG